MLDEDDAAPAELEPAALDAPAALLSGADDDGAARLLETPVLDERLEEPPAWDVVAAELLLPLELLALELVAPELLLDEELATPGSTPWVHAPSVNVTTTTTQPRAFNMWIASENAAWCSQGRISPHRWPSNSSWWLSVHRR